MCALRNTRNINPTALATSYRTDNKPYRTQPPVLVRKRNSLPTPTTIQRFNFSRPSSSYNSKNLSSTCTSRSCADLFDDSDEDFDLDTKDELVAKENDTQESDVWLKSYLSMCKKLNRLPLTSLKRKPKSKTLTVKFVKLQFQDLMSLCVAIRLSNIKHIDFENNGIGPEGGDLIAQTVDDNEFVTHVRVATNNLMTAGVKAICEAAANAMNLVVLDLSDTGIEENDAVHIKELIVKSESLQEIYLSHNKILSEGTKVIARALKYASCSLRVLDLSWNHIRLDGAEAIGKALAINKSLEKLNLAWNGLHMLGAISIGMALKKNTTLKELDLTCNRMTETCIAELLKGLNKNSTLEAIHLGQNHVSCKGAVLILENIRDNKHSAIKFIDLGKQEVDDKFESLYREIQRERRAIHIVHGSVLKSERKPISSYDDQKAQSQILQSDPLTVLMECMRLQNYRILDKLNKEDTENVDIEELCDEMIRGGVPLHRNTLIRMLERLDKDGNNQLNYKELVDARRVHQDLVCQSLQTGTKFEESDVGRVSLLLRQIKNQNFIMKKA